ncbi:MAG: hypothetical protein SW833_20470 [Cyanobacteriota bacterium]|nr:hypothetical protein [Cyanobacteriota bacterium]
MTQNSIPSPNINKNLDRQVLKLHQFSLYRRWLFVGLCWLGLAPVSLWILREQISLGMEHFTWALVRYSVIFYLTPSLCLGFCVATTTAVLVWQSSNILFGFSPEYRRRLERQVFRIRASGQSHPLWKRVCQ